MHPSRVPVVEIELVGQAIVRVGRAVVLMAPVVLRTVVEPDDTAESRLAVDGDVVFERRERGPRLAARWRAIVNALMERSGARRP